MNFLKTVSITDHEIVKPNLAKVIISYTGNPTKSEVIDLLASKLKYLASPVEDSFRQLTKASAIGFVRANRQIRNLDQAAKRFGDVTARYKVMSSNMLMDKQDRTLWELKSGPTGEYVVRHGNEDLSELIEAGTNHSRGDIPRMSAVTAARAAKSDFAAYCNANGVMEYGFVVKANAKGCIVINSVTKQETPVANKMIASLSPVTIDRELHNNILAEMQGGRVDAAEYWRTLFNYAPEYAEEMADAVNAYAVL